MTRLIYLWLYSRIELHIVTTACNQLIKSIRIGLDASHFKTNHFNFV
jgi:hypothetical protein